MKEKGIVLLISISIILLTGCAVKKIKYGIDDIQPQPNEFLSTKKLNVDLFEDIRNKFPENKILFEQSRFAKIDGQNWCINSEYYYTGETNPETVSKGITDMIATHFNKRAAFGAVILNEKEKADYNLTGKIKRFYAKHKPSTAVNIGASFALIGVLLTSGIKTPAVVEITITDIKLYGKHEELIKELNDIEEKFEGNEKPDAYCLSPYWLLNKKLKTVVEKLAGEVEKALID